MRRYLTIVWGILFLAGCGAPTAPIVPVDVSVTAVPVPATEPALEVVAVPTEALVVESYPAQPTAVPDLGGYPAQVPAQPTYSPYPAPVDEANPANANVLFVRAEQAADGTWTFDVTVEHPNEDETNYADGWDIITPEGQVIKLDVADAFTRPLEHPHADEQPFTRSQSGLVIPADATQVFVRAHDSVHGWGGQMVFVDLNVPEGVNYQVVRP